MENRLSPRPQVAHVEDDPSHRLLVATLLESAGFEVHSFADTDSFRRHVRGSSVDLVLLDWMLPDGCGLELLEWIRASNQSKLPVILITGREADEDVVTGLTAGADDYIVKPPHPAQLLARINAVMRRSGFAAQTAMNNEFAPYFLREDLREIHLNNERIPTTDREFDLMQYLFRRRGNIVSRETLLKQVWNMQGLVSSRTVDTHVSRLRKKLELEGQHGWTLSGVFQHGYRLEQNAEAVKTA